MSNHLKAVLFCLLFTLVTVCGFLFRHKKHEKFGCEVVQSPLDKPFYFGTSDLLCVTTSFSFRFKRDAPRRNAQSPLHRWIFYDGHYIEFGTDSGKHVVSFFNDASSYSIKTNLPFRGDICPWKMEESPAGFSRLPIECLASCAENYDKVFGKYNLLFNNCHHFANVISEILCSNVCPPWCVPTSPVTYSPIPPTPTAHAQSHIDRADPLPDYVPV